MNEQRKENPLGCAPIAQLMVKFAVPSIVAMLVGALYNIVDQFFIGQAVGKLGNAATNIAFPLSTSCIAIALLFGIGGASCFNLHMGRGDKEKAAYYIGNAAVMLFSCGLVLCIISQVFLMPLLKGFGAPQDVLPYAATYVRITSVGFPFLILTTGGGHLIRADGRPKIAMICNLTGAVVNTILDAVFVLKLNMGMAGAAYATIIGQILSAAIVVWCLRHYKTVPLLGEHLKIRWSHAANARAVCPNYIREIASLGMASFFNQIAMMIVQIVMNNSLKYYGALSVYGDSTPLACAGIVMKVSQVFFSIVIGIGQGSQPIESFNYGAKKYERVREAYRLAMIAGGSISVLAFLLFQIVPRPILAMFGKGDETYYQFGVEFFRIFLFFIWLNFMQPITSTFFTSIGKPIKGIFLSMTRQILFLLPLLMLLPRFIGIKGILYAGPISDLMAGIAAVVMARVEFKEIRRLERQV